MLRNNNKIIFGDLQIEAFNSLKKALTELPVLMLYDSEAETELHTDASMHCIGSVLLKWNPEDDELHPIYYYSRKTTRAQERSTSYELEILAIGQSLERFRVYLLSIPFRIVTDCKAFKDAVAKKEVSAKIARWTMFLDEFNFSMEHRSGTKIGHVHALSRYSLMIRKESSMLKEIEELQKTDAKLRPILKILERWRNMRVTIC